MAKQTRSVVIHGAGGRMGGRLVALSGDAGLNVAAAIDRPDHPRLGDDAGAVAGGESLGIPLTADWPDANTHVDAVIEFSAPAGLRGAIDRCVEAGWPMVIGTTGLTADDEAKLDEAAKATALLHASNFSRVVNVLWTLAAEAARMLGDDYDLEVLEAHHRFKHDAPSGTALTLVRKLCEATGRDFNRDVVYARHGEAPRQKKDITVQTLRIGDDPGQHNAFFAGLGERLEIKHVSTSRDSYASGALDAAKWLMNKPAGRYDIRDVLGL